VNSRRNLPHVQAAIVAIAGLLLTAPAGESGAAQGLSTREVIDRVGIDQKLEAQVPGDVQLVDETGREVRLEEFYGDKPILLNLVYFECPMLCNLTMDGLLRSLKTMSLDVGRDFTVLTVSFDPREGPELAAKARQTALRRYGREGAGEGWRFLTGTEEELKRLTDAVGFRYAYDNHRGEYAHAAALVALTPAGKVSRYLTGVEFPARDLRLSLVEASNHEIGSPLDRAILLCYHYDPVTGRYGLAVINAIRFLSVVTVAGLVAVIAIFLRRERRQPPGDATADEHRAKNKLTTGIHG
jgi:protein SCO1